MVGDPQPVVHVPVPEDEHPVMLHPAAQTTVAVQEPAATLHVEDDEETVPAGHEDLQSLPIHTVPPFTWPYAWIFPTTWSA